MTFAHRIFLCAALPTALSALGGCGGAQAGGQTGEETEKGCVFSTSPLSQQEQSPLGFSADEALALAAGEREATMKWQSTPGITYGPETGTSQLTLRTAARGPALLARVNRTKSTAANCEDHVSIPVDVALATSGGAFDESFAATLVATAADEARVSRTLPSAELQGQFAFSQETLGARRFVRLEVELRFGADGSAGYLLGGIEGGGGSENNTSFQPVPLACWGDSASLMPPCAD